MGDDKRPAEISSGPNDTVRQVEGGAAAAMAPEGGYSIERVEQVYRQVNESMSR